MELNINKIQEERLKDWLIEKYDWKCYKQAEAEFNKKHSWWRRNWGINEEDRLWLIERTKELLDIKLKEYTS